MLKRALKLMQTLKPHKTLLIGSAWRGTIHYSNDVDIVVYNDESGEILELLGQSSLKIAHIEWITATKRRNHTLYVYAKLPTGEKVEVRIIPESEASKKRECDIY